MAAEDQEPLDGQSLGRVEYDAGRDRLSLLQPQERTLVDPREAADAVPHFGRPGGVLPQVEEGYDS